jgi:uncharacterized delta-60 repeat protein
MFPFRFASWLKTKARSLCGGEVKAPRRRASRRLTLDCLEDRWLPSAGALDLTFSTNGTGKEIASLTGAFEDMLVQPDDKIVVVGHTDGGVQVARYLPNGTPDTSFAGDGKVFTSLFDYARGMVIQPDGKIVVVGSDLDSAGADFALLRLLPNGSLDTSFGVSGKVSTQMGASDSFAEASSVTIQADGRIVVAGYSNGDVALTRYLPNGALDSDFDADGRVITDLGVGLAGATGVAVRSDGTIVVTGNSQGQMALLMYSVEGSLISSTLTNAGSRINDMHLLQDGRVLAVGTSNDDFALVRYRTDGQLDTTFGGGDGMVFTDFAASIDRAADLTVQVNGKILVAGSTDAGGSLSNFALARYLPDGTLDVSFSNDGKVITDFISDADACTAVAVQSDGKIVAIGDLQNGTNHLELARYEGDPPPTITIANASVLEGDSGSVGFNFVIQRSGVIDTGLNVHIATRNGSGQAGSDYIAQAGTVFFPPNQATVTVGITVLADVSPESNEVFFLDVNGPIAGGLVTAQATIIDDDQPSSTLSGFVYNDANFNGSRDAGESGLAGVTVELRTVKNFVVKTATTSSTGEYVFSSVLAGTYYIVEVQPSTASDGEEQVGELGGTVSANDRFTVTVPTGGGVVAGGYNFGEHPTTFNFNFSPLFPNRSITSPIDEGDVAVLTGTVADADAHDRFTLTINWGDGSPVEIRHFGASGPRDISVPHRYLYSGVYTVHLDWRDQHGAGNSGDLQVVVNNVAPQLLSPGDLGVGPSGRLNRPVLFRDPGADAWTPIIDYGDGTVEQIPSVQAKVPFRLRHSYRTAGTYQVTVVVIDEDGDIGEISFLVEVPGRDFLIDDLAIGTRNHRRR